jgi:succinate dehydrogenase / fumarate reductase cytochrome b subunit
MAAGSPPLPAAPDRPWIAPAAGAAHHEWGWALQAITGVGVLVLVTIHMVANHFVVPEGLRDYAGVVAYLSSPVIVALEVAFLVTVTWHALLGVRAILFDFGFSTRVERLITRALAVLGVLVVGYGLWLTGVIIAAG